MQPGITDAEAKVRAKAWDVFKFWLDAQDRAKLDAADPVELARRYPPLPAEDIALMIRCRRRVLK